mgnify:FL=1|jgi:hypothetical protein
MTNTRVVAMRNSTKRAGNFKIVNGAIVAKKPKLQQKTRKSTSWIVEDLAQKAALKRTRTLGHGTAWSKAKRVKPTRVQPKVGRKFKKKVEKVLDYDKPFGEYRYIADQQLRQNSRDTFNEFSTDNNGMYFDFFGPLSVWDAASICFNNKAASPFSRNSTAVTNGTNIPYSQTVHVSNSYVEFEFKSTSAHVVNLEMYICQPKADNEVAHPSDYINDQTSLQGDQYFYQNPPGTYSQRSVNFMADLGTKNGDWSSCHRVFKIVKVQFKFNPGESKRFFLQGPKNFSIDGQKYGSDGGGSIRTFTKFTKTIFFRVINDPTVCGQTDSVLRQTVGQWNSNNVGGIAMRYMYSVRTRMPDNVAGDITNLATYNLGLQNQRRNQVMIGNWIKRYETDIDQQVVVMNPIATAANNN